MVQFNHPAPKSTFLFKLFKTILIRLRFYGKYGLPQTDLITVLYVCREIGKLFPM